MEWYRQVQFVSAVAMPHGVRCFTMTTVGSSNVLTARHAESRSRMLL